MTKGPIPVVPAQHYTCGGVPIDPDGRTDLPGLYAAGEVTESGLHGANRLASNSLLECFVFGEAAAKHIARHWDELGAPPAIRPWAESRVTDSDEEVVIKQNRSEEHTSELQSLMRISYAVFCLKNKIHCMRA